MTTPLTVKVRGTGEVDVIQAGSFEEIQAAYVALGEHVIRMLKQRKGCPFNPEHKPTAKRGRCG